ncbi:MAG: thioredoxin fold domain-containing protein [candidate division Zixibacteria bacterium]|nr:thioredoxin fold domain-containing protein [candidate division Zixibacteria bacterium]
MKTKTTAMIALTGMLLASGAVRGDDVKKATPLPTTASAEIVWLNYDAGLAKAKAENKPIMLDFTTTWCGWCKKMERETFTDPKVARYLHDKIVTVKVWGDDTSKATMVSHNGERMTQRALTQVYGVRGFPTFWFLDSSGGQIGPSPGYKNVDQFLPLIEYVAGSHYKTMSYESYLKKRSG